MSRFWQAWVAFWSRKEPGTSIALFRIAIGLCVGFTILHVVSLGLADVVWVDAEFGGYRKLGDGPWLVALMGGASPLVIAQLVWLNIGLSLFLVLGVGGRLTAFCLLQSYMALTDGNSHAGGSYDELMMNALWLLVLAPSTATLSVDCWRRTGRWVSEVPVLAFGRYLVIFQLLLMYWTTGLQKVSAYWVPGGDFSALYYIFQQPSWQRFDMGWVAPLFPLTQLGTGMSWFWEVSAPVWLLALWYDNRGRAGGRLQKGFERLRVKWIYLAVGVFFHGVVLVFMSIGPFSYVSLAFYACLIRPDEWERVFKRFGAYRLSDTASRMAS
jgi:hypothetical protein